MDTSSKKIIQPKKTRKKGKEQKAYEFKGDSKIAVKYGDRAAILIKYFQHVITLNKRNDVNFHEGRYWTYNSLNDLASLHPFWTVKILKRIIKHLKDKNVLITGNFNKIKYDRTTWFAFKDEEKFIQIQPVDNSVDNFGKFTNKKVEIDRKHGFYPVDNFYKNPRFTRHCPSDDPEKCYPVDKSVDNSEKPVDNPVDNLWITFYENHEKSSEEIRHSSQFNTHATRRNGHWPIWAHRKAHLGPPIPILNNYLNSSDEVVGCANHNNNGGIKKNNNGMKKKFASKITKGYILPGSLRRKIQELGFKDHEIDKEIINMIIYHAENPQIISNEHSCVLGWFKKSLEYKNRKK